MVVALAWRAAELGSLPAMAIGTALFLIAVGAILRYGVSDSVEGIDLPTIGLILIIVGVIGMVISFFMMSMWRRDRDVDVVERRTVDRRDPYA
jgi:hypothetical protein